ncbi:MAG: acylphosphatase [Candidatus Aureabacteria bacterium]|nr:acylphosphatase [Candidatus Auribacterota bacterium]
MVEEQKVIRYRVVVRGRVQGVCFRYYAVDAAKKLDIRGWVRNLWSGEVEALVEGKEPQAQQMLNWLREGPPMAHVTNVKVTEEPVRKGEFQDFTVTY